LNVNDRFTVKSMYNKLKVLMLEGRSITEVQMRVFTHIWKSLAPSKVAAFCWKRLHDRISTKANLLHRRVLQLESSLGCVMCTREEESSKHLFLHCEFTRGVWDGIMRWLDFSFISPPN